MFMSGEQISADRAYQLGFLSHRVNAEDLDSAVGDLAQTLLANAPDGVRKAKEIAGDVAQGDVSNEMIERTVRFIADLRDSTEGREGLNAFLEKRAPGWLN